MCIRDRGGSVLIIGFGRFGQVMSQSLLARDVDVTIIDNDIDMIRSAEEFGFKIYYGDGTRLDVLHASGAHSARAIAVCIDGKESVNKIVELVKAEFPLLRLLVRSYDREHALELINAGVDYQIRETFESAVNFGAAALVELGVTDVYKRQVHIRADRGGVGFRFQPAGLFRGCGRFRADLYRYRHAIAG